MNIKTREHFGNLKNILKENGLSAMLDYDIKISRIRNKALNVLLAKGNDFHEKTEYGINAIAQYDPQGVLRKLRLNPDREDYVTNLKWDFEFK